MRVGLFPGQGIPARTVLEALPAGHGILALADETLGYDLRRGVDIAARRKGAMLPTALAQPAIFVAGLISWEEFDGRNGIEWLAGHSIGEYTALVAGGAMSPETGLRIVKVRAEGMESVSRIAKGGMAAVLGLPFETASSVAEQAGVTLANDNAPDQVVFAGGDAALAEAAKLVRSAGGRSVLLETAGPFHTTAMAPAAQALERALAGAELRTPSIPVISNVTARPHESPSAIRKLLVAQLTSRVRFRESLEWLWTEGARESHDFGPGAIAAGLAKRTFRHLAGLEVTVNA